MLYSRGVPLGRLLSNVIAKSPINVSQKQIIRMGHAWSYRVAGPPHSKAVKIMAPLVGGVMWWWVLWHLWHDYQHITGEFEYPDPTAWTNAELGIPPDDE